VFVFSTGSATTCACRLAPFRRAVAVHRRSGATTTAVWPAGAAEQSQRRSSAARLAQTQNFAAKLLWPAGGQAVTTTMAGGTTAGAAGLPITVFLDGFLYRLPQ
jgi:hypothetical protein